LRPKLIGAAIAAAAFAPFLSQAAPAADEPVLGELPAGGASGFEVRDVRAEVCLRQVFPASAVPVDLPHGYRLATLAEKAKTPWTADLLRKRPELRDYARGSFCFVDSGVHTINGRPVHPARRRSTFAFSWVDIVPTEGAPTDARFHGAPRRMQLFWIYDSAGVDRKLARTALPDAMFGRIRMAQSGDSWLIRLDMDGGVLTGRVKPTTARQRLVYPEPGYETVLLGGAPRDNYFTVITFAGHHERLAEGEWKVSGKPKWVRSIVPDIAIEAGSFIQDGWAASSRLYAYKQD